MKTNIAISAAVVAAFASVAVAAEINVPAGKTEVVEPGKCISGDALVKTGAGVLDLSCAKLNVASIEIREGGVKFAASAAKTEKPVKTRFLRWSITATRPHGEHTNSGPQYSEFRIYRNGKLVPFPAGTRATGGNQNPAEGPAKAIDGDVHTKYYCSTPLTLELGREVELDAYSFVTANDATGRDPRGWTLEAGERRGNRIVWQGIGVESNFEAPQQRFADAGKLFKVGPGPSFPAHIAIKIGGKGRLVLDGMGGYLDNVSGCGLIESNTAVTLPAGSGFTGSVAGGAAVNWQ